MRLLRVCPVIVTFAALYGGTVSAQSDYARELYGNGVHAYNAGRLAQALENLEAATAGDSQDPRAYYFLGLAKLQTGDTFGAESDFSRAATLEFQGIGTYDVGMALSRVQGQTRMRLEKVRRETKLSLRSAPRALPAQPSEPVPQIAPSPYDDAPADLLPKSPAVDLGDPFTDDPEPSDAGADDPFGGDVNLEDDPFGTEPDAAPEAASQGATGGAASAALRALLNAGRKAVPAPKLPNLAGQAPGVIPGNPPPTGPPPAAAPPPPAAAPPAAQAETNEADLFGAGDDPFADAGDDPFATEADQPAAAAPAAPPQLILRLKTRQRAPPRNANQRPQEKKERTPAKLPRTTRLLETTHSLETTRLLMTKVS